MDGDSSIVEQAEDAADDAETPPAADPVVPEPPAAPPDRLILAHPFFAAVPDSYFRISPHTRQPVFVLDIGGAESALSFSGIRREFGLPADSPDSLMLDMVERGLAHVRVLRPGDALPREILTGEASWQVEERHRTIARQRLDLQLTSWASGSEHVITDLQQLSQLADDPAMPARVDAAIAAAAQTLALDHPQVTADLANLAEELAFIEALRERFGTVAQAVGRMRAARRIVARDRLHADTVDRICRLATLATTQLAGQFEQADAQTGEIVASLRNRTAQERFIRTLRDELYARICAWDDLIPGWCGLDAQRPHPSPTLLDESYRFLASRFMPAEEWVLATRRGASNQRALKNAVTW